jgi:hypothetical protein
VNLALVVTLVNGAALLLLMMLFFLKVDVQTLVNKVSFKKPLYKIQSKQSQTALTKNFYRLYKYMYLQSASGSRPEELLKTLYRVVNAKKLRKSLLQMSVIIAQSNDVQKALKYLRYQFNHEEGQILIGILESIAISGLSKDAFLRLDQMLFQKYLSQMRRDTSHIKRLYFYSVVCFVAAASGVLFLPLIDQMLKSANIIFN